VTNASIYGHFVTSMGIEGDDVTLEVLSVGRSPPAATDPTKRSTYNPNVGPVHSGARRTDVDVAPLLPTPAARPS
jgi:hypothetical protein